MKKYVYFVSYRYFEPGAQNCVGRIEVFVDKRVDSIKDIKEIEESILEEMRAGLVPAITGVLVMHYQLLREEDA